MLGLPEIYYSPEEESVGYVVGGLQITITVHSSPPEVAGWAAQLGWEGGTESAPSWGFECTSREFERAIQAVPAAPTTNEPIATRARLPLFWIANREYSRRA